MKIKATQPFTHAGQTVNTGDVIDVPADAAAWLIAQGVAETADDRKAAATPKLP